MKGRHVILFACGLLGGWWLAGNPIASSAVATWRHSATLTSGTELSETVPQRDGLPHLEDGQILVSEDRLKELMAMHRSPTLRSEDFTGEAYKEPIDQLARWVGLNASAKEELTRLLRDANATRLAWEKQHAQISKAAPGKWVIEIPGDGGAAKTRLLSDLREAFGHQQAETLILAGDLESFFQLPFQFGTDGRPAGKIEVEVSRFSGGSSEDETHYFRLNGNLTVVTGSEADYEVSFLRRVKHLLPGYPQLHDEALTTPIPNREAGSDPFASPFDRQ